MCKIHGFIFTQTSKKISNSQTLGFKIELAPHLIGNNLKIKKFIVNFKINLQLNIDFIYNRDQFSIFVSQQKNLVLIF